MGITYGYARCSTDETRQNIDRQKRELKSLGASTENIFFEYASGAKTDREQLNRLINTVTEGDSIAATEVSRLTRSTKQLCEILQLVQERHLRLIIGSFVVDCRTDSPDPMTRGMLMMMAVFAEMEREMISQRVKSGLANARSKGAHIGRPELTLETIPGKWWKYYGRYKSNQLTVSDLSRLLSCSRTTIYRYIHVSESNKEGEVNEEVND